MTESHFSKEQLDILNQRANLLGPDRIKAVENEWPQLIAKMRLAMEQALPASSPEVVQLARRWQELVELFTGGDPGIRSSLERSYQENPERGEAVGIDGDLWRYVHAAMTHL